MLVEEHVAKVIRTFQLDVLVGLAGLLLLRQLHVRLPWANALIDTAMLEQDRHVGLLGLVGLTTPHW